MVLSAGSLAFGDRTPRPQIATGTAEESLAGIRVRNVPIEDVIEKFGPPESKRDVPDAGQCVHEYNWSKDGVRARVRTGCVRDDADAAEGVSSIDVWGSKATGEIGKTGKGLKLGDAFSTVQRVYGLSPQLAPNGLIHVEVRWTDDTVMVIDCGRNRTVSHIQLGIENRTGATAGQAVAR
jgi:hypothetical protein